MEVMIYSTFEELYKAIRKATSTKAMYEEFKEMQEYCINNHDQTIQLVSRLKVDELKTMVYSRSGDKKEKLVRNVADSLLSLFLMGDTVSYSPFEEKYQDALIRKIQAQTREQWEKWIEERKIKIEARRKALENPETIEEFRVFIERKGINELTSEQKARYDELTADRQKDIKTMYAPKIEAVKTSVGMILKNSTHTKKNIPLYVVQLSERVERDKYNELNSRAKKLGGYYSSYNKGGAIPGFTFEDEKNAKLFMDNETLSSQEIKEERKADKIPTRAEALREKAQAIEEAATEELTKERNANTHRRARFAASAEAQATKKIEFAKTLFSIADGLEAGTIMYLQEIKAATELEQLETLINLAKWRHIRAKNLRSDEYEITEETAEYLEYPYPRIYKSNAIILEKLKQEPGKKLAAARMLKRFDRGEYITMNNPQRIEDYEILFNYSRLVDKYELENYKNQLVELKRIQRIGLETIEQLRAAARELINLKKNATISPELKRIQQIREIERKFIGQKIEGFFPTPELLAREIVRLANIQDGETILEPSAGLGHIAEIIEEMHPDNELQLVENYSPLVKALELKGFNVADQDFLQFTSSYDKIIMNPPFENLQDIDHVLHAYELLKPGGRLVAIMAANKNSDRQKIRDFMEFVENNGYFNTNPEGSFKSSFRPTGAGTITVVLDK